MAVDPPAHPYGELLGLELLELAGGLARVAIDVGPELHNPSGRLHGAVPFSVADTAMGAALVSVLEPGQDCASIEIQIRFLRSVAGGRLTGEARVIHRGRRIAHLQCEIRDAAGALVAATSGSYAILERGR